MISIHAPRAGSDTIKAYWPMDGTISIHAPRAGSDTAALCPFSDGRLFQSTLPVRGAT